MYIFSVVMFMMFAITFALYNSFATKKLDTNNLTWHVLQYLSIVDLSASMIALGFYIAKSEHAFFYHDLGKACAVFCSGVLPYVSTLHYVQRRIDYAQYRK